MTHSTHAPSYAYLKAAPRGVLKFYSEEQLRATLAIVEKMDTGYAREIERAILAELASGAREGFDGLDG